MLWESFKCQELVTWFLEKLMSLSRNEIAVQNTTRLSWRKGKAAQQAKTSSFLKATYLGNWPQYPLQWPPSKPDSHSRHEPKPNCPLNTAKRCPQNEQQKFEQEVLSELISSRDRDWGYERISRWMCMFSLTGLTVSLLIRSWVLFSFSQAFKSNLLSVSWIHWSLF